MPTLHVELFAGRTVEQEPALTAALAEACVETLGGSPGAVDIIFRDVARHDWARGGRLWSDPAPAKPEGG